MTRFRSTLAIAAVLAAAATTAAAPAVAALWDGVGYVQYQGPQKGRPGPDRGGPPPGGGRDMRQQQGQLDRRDRMSEDDRRSLHRDLDKANRELYGRRFQK
jgi:opacity protein-like surface antigen